MLSHLRRLLPSRLDPRRLRAQKCTLRLPTELVDMILEYLPPESVVAFVLTCRVFYSRHFPRPAHLSSSAKETLLHWLDQDTPSLYFCHDCTRLHSWRRALKPAPPCYRGPCRAINSASGHMRESLRTLRWRFNYIKAQLAMNRHLYGPLHGPPLRRFEEAKSGFDTFHGVSITYSWRARIISDKLYVRGTTVIRRGKGGDEISLRAFIDFYGRFLVCGHLQADDGVYSDRGIPVIPELGQDHSSPGPPFRQVSGGIRSCSVCYTDYQMEVTLRDPLWYERSSRGRDWVIEVNRWHRLGSCRSPYDLEWNNLVAMRPENVSVPRSHGCAAGMVRNEWMGQEAGSASLPVEGTFVSLSGEKGI
ncbi:hypothetical protein QBC46DRAFT_318997 [Diplogelasinospora grovesii]|uniref:F-box domain-containing protein n=1 Tax=Diplogelasinospora grovesii TaxID=303347 RepID=A0AAN6N359_9PEZI|nr:hypothetical protein QBC46DRAFT_318997 [Diplogelasinospora grovesii]